MRGGAAVRWRLVVAHAFPDVENEEVAVEGEAFEGDITGGEDIAAAGLGVGQAVFGRGDDLLWGTGLHGGAVDVTAEGDLIAVQALDLGEVNVAHRRLLQRVDAVPIGLVV